ncbi:MAG: hypothetical protein G01um101417_387 [Parcubacteria group bacterium Gr01-1014_17]|nr:MAG: hypothetical protein G01um101417_387 [Parcubacteria group bacterium Gr01-1014_17]
MIETLGGLLFFLSVFYGNTEISSAAPTPIVPVADNPITLEQYVRDYFADNAVLAEVAKCESRFRHFDAYGVLRGDYDRNDVGVMQINERYHSPRAERNGFDIKTLEGNLGYAKWLYDKEGLQPWASSGKCWKGAQTLAVVKDANQKN